MTQGRIHAVGVVGLGTMGAGIAEVFARNGFTVIAVEADAGALERGQQTLEQSTARAVKRGKLDADEQAALWARVTYSTDLQDLAAANLVVEAIPERLELKRDLFAALDQLTPPEIILATNTSSLSVTEISVSTSRPDRVVGMHFFNPAPVQKFVEIVRTVVSAPEVIDEVTDVAKRLGKEPVVVGDRAGFIANALLFGYLNHAVAMYDSRYATREDIDEAMKLGCGYPMGPLALMDLIGLDTAYEILDTMYKEGRDKLHAPHPLLKQMVTAGLRGRKSGRGFYTYAEPHSPVVVDDAETALATPEFGQGRPVSSVAVVGSGTMASGIAEVFAKADYQVLLVARSIDKAEAALAGITKSMEKAVQRGKIESTERDAALNRISLSARLEDVDSVDLIVEAIAENLDVKIALFENLDEIARPGAILATTTSSLPVVEMAVATSRPGDVVGLHFFNPAAQMNLVEVVRTVCTSDEVTATALEVVDKTGKRAVVCGDRAGFIVNALLFPYLNDSVRMLEANYASVDDIDLAMKKGCGYPMGPFELLDVVGLDVSLTIQQTLYREFRERGFAPAPRLEHFVTAGYVGKKSGRGFRTYS